MWLLIIITLFKGLLWSLFIPMWHFPDEQAHFNHVAFNVERPNLINFGKGLDLNQEIAISEQLLGTYRDEQGNNSFTYHPEYNPEYSNSQQGTHEEQIKNLPLETRFNLVGRESAYYPETYYNLSGLIYKLFYNQDIFVRVFAIRIFWLFLLTVIVWSAYRLAWLLKSNRLFALTAATLTAFHPMLTFVSSGITSDSLFNALYSLLILLAANLLIKFSIWKLFFIAIITGIGVNTKPQFLASLAISIPVILLSLWPLRHKIKLRQTLIFSCIGLMLVYSFGGYRQVNILIKSWSAGIPIPYFSSQASVLLPNYTLLDHFIWTVKHTIREVVPWFWGVFRWLSLALSVWVNRVLNRLVLVSGLGLIIYSFKLFKQRKITREMKIFIFILYTAVIYFVTLLVWDWDFFRSHNFSFGIQGRYYFPVIVSCMILIVIGLQSISKYLNLLVSYWFIALNWISFYIVVSSYYDTNNFKTFIIQASQYKPFFAKGWWLIVALGLYFIFSLIFSYQLFRVFRHEK